MEEEDTCSLLTSKRRVGDVLLMGIEAGVEVLGMEGAVMDVVGVTLLIDAGGVDVDGAGVVLKIDACNVVSLEGDKLAKAAIMALTFGVVGWGVEERPPVCDEEAVALDVEGRLALELAKITGAAAGIGSKGSSLSTAFSPLSRCSRRASFLAVIAAFSAIIWSRVRTGLPEGGVEEVITAKKPSWW